MPSSPGKQASLASPELTVDVLGRKRQVGRERAPRPGASPELCTFCTALSDWHLITTRKVCPCSMSSPRTLGNVRLCAWRGVFRVGAWWPCVVSLVDLVSGLWSCTLGLAVFCLPLGSSEVFQTWTSLQGIPSLVLTLASCLYPRASICIRRENRRWEQGQERVPCAGDPGWRSWEMAPVFLSDFHPHLWVRAWFIGTFTLRVFLKRVSGVSGYWD